ncbi:MAG: hypothetical protein U1B77_00370 [Dehalococcoidales bacterium]|nr:hypothetical protein [Dehalococcoidales bacterium]
MLGRLFGKKRLCMGRERGYFDILWALMDAESRHTYSSAGQQGEDTWAGLRDYAADAAAVIAKEGESPENLKALEALLAEADKGHLEDTAYGVEDLLIKSAVQCRCHKTIEAPRLSW